MCGIIYKRADNGANVTEDIATRYRLQAARGTQGFGFIIIRDKNIIVHRAQYEKDILKKLKKRSASEILFHHRMPTSTRNYLDSTHPLLVTHKDLPHAFYVVHNGIITNAAALRTQHEKLGFAYRTLATNTLQTRTQQYISHEFNDSEALAIDFALTISGKQTKMKAEGSIAFIALALEKKTNKPVKLYYGRDHYSTLTTSETALARTIASEGGQPIAAHTLYTFYYDTRETAKDDFTIGLSRVYPTYPATSMGYGGTGSWEQYDDDDRDDAYETAARYVRTGGTTLLPHGHANDTTFRAARVVELDEKLAELYELLKIAIDDKQPDERAWILEDIEELEDERAYYGATTP